MDIVNNRVAKRLQELRYNGHCLFFRDNDGNIVEDMTLDVDFHYNPLLIPYPTWLHVVDWLVAMHDIYCLVTKGEDKLTCDITNMYGDTYFSLSVNSTNIEDIHRLAVISIIFNDKIINGKEQ